MTNQAIPRCCHKFQFFRIQLLVVEAFFIVNRN